MRAWVRAAVTVGCLSPLACGGGTSEKPGTDGGMASAPDGVSRIWRCATGKDVLNKSSFL